MEQEQQLGVVQPVLGNVVGFTKESTPSGREDPLLSPTMPATSSSPLGQLANPADASQGRQVSTPSIETKPASVVCDHVSSVSSGLGDTRLGSASAANLEARTRSRNTEEISRPNASLSDSPSLVQDDVLSKKQRTSSLSVDDVTDHIISVSNSNKVGITAPQSRSSSVPPAISAQQEPSSHHTLQPESTLQSSVVPQSDMSQKSGAFKADSIVDIRSMNTDPSEAGSSVHQQDVGRKDSSSIRSLQDNVVEVNQQQQQRYDDTPYSYADDDSFNISDEASDSFDSELSDPASRKVIQVKESSNSALNSVSEKPTTAGADDRTQSLLSPNKSGPIVIPGTIQVMNKFCSIPKYKLQLLSDF